MINPNTFVGIEKLLIDTLMEKISSLNEVKTGLIIPESED